MRAYIIRRLLLMIPTLFGVTLVTFSVMKMAPGDPLKEQLAQGGAQSESGSTHEAYIHQRRQWKLDKPSFLNGRWFHDYSSQARKSALLYGLADGDLEKLLDRLAEEVRAGRPSDTLDFVRSLGIEGVDQRLLDPEARKGLAPIVRIAVQIKVEDEMGEHGVRSLGAELDEKDLALQIGAIRCLLLCTLGDPFRYTYSKEPKSEETAGVVATWKIWWDRNHDQFKPVAPERLQELKATLRTLSAESSRSKVIEAMDGFTPEDVPFFAEVLFSGSTLSEKVVASTALFYKVGRVLKADVKLSDKAPLVASVAANWKAFIATHGSEYSPPIPAKCLYFFTDTQYANSLVKLLTFDFGRSMVKPYDPVGPKMFQAVLVSAPIMLLSEALVYLFAVPLGVLCAVHRGKWQDRSTSLVLFVFNSFPSVVLGMLLLTFFCFGTFFKFFPMYGIHAENYESFPFVRELVDYLNHIFLPLVCYSLTSLAGLAMFARSSMLDVLNQDFVRTARAKGLQERSVILKHSMRNALIPVLTLFASFIPALLGGSVIIEYLFGIPGMGRLSYDSIQAKDYNMVMAITYLDAIIVMLSILLTDLLYVFVDPRISFQKSEGGA